MIPTVNRGCKLFGCCCVAAERPRMVDSDSEKTIEAGDDVQFTCEAYGTPKPFFLWYKDDVLLDQSHPRSLDRFWPFENLLFTEVR